MKMINIEDILIRRIEKLKDILEAINISELIPDDNQINDINSRIKENEYLLKLISGLDSDSIYIKTRL